MGEAVSGYLVGIMGGRYSQQLLLFQSEKEIQNLKLEKQYS